jgi:gamma-glutamyltranspeptidase
MLPAFSPFASRRSAVYSLNGMVACTQPLAAVAGQRLLRQGGNAAVGYNIRFLLTEYTLTTVIH